jgi:hypothetical protein
LAKLDEVTNDGLLGIVLDRVRALQQTDPCREYVLAASKLEDARSWLERRRRDVEEGRDE